MKKFNALKMLPTLLLIVTVSGCASTTVKDKEACADLGYVGAHCAHTYSSGKRDIPKDDWDMERVGWICVHPNDFSDTEDAIDELCRTTNKCDYETKEVIKKFKEKMHPLVEDGKRMRQVYGLP